MEFETKLEIRIFGRFELLCENKILFGNSVLKT